MLLNETIAALAPQAGETLLDCTAGLGGHAAALARGLGSGGAVVLFDLDPGNLALARARVAAEAPGVRIETVHASFAEAPRRLPALGLRADTVLADLGFASPQVDDPARGFSFSRDGPLDMRLNPMAGPTAADLVNSLPLEELTRIIGEYGEERRARAVAERIIAARAVQPLRSTGDLAELVRSVVRRSAPSHGGRGIDPATRTFQAMRIAVNDELGNLEALLASVSKSARVVGSPPRSPAGAAPPPGWLAEGARIAIISFHSLEDRPVKRAFGELVSAGRAREITRGAVQASEAEIGRNPRAGSAKLRAIRLTPGERGAQG